MTSSEASFRFNFGDQDAAHPPAPADCHATAAPGREESPSLEVPPSWQVEELDVGGLVLLKADGATVAAAAAHLGHASTATSDLIPGAYEGGCKLWECSVDLCRYLAAGGKGAPILSGSRVLELGCGHGLPGVVAALRGAHSVTWQDYNGDVLHSLTAPTAVANLRLSGREAQGSRLRFMSGDWGALHALLPAQQYDLILTADTLYSPAAQPRLLALITHCLSPGGVALVAAKSFYFGVGGSTADFAAAVGSVGVLRAETVARLQDGASNVREILRLSHRQ